MSLRIALSARRDLMMAPGGDTMQIISTAEELRQRGHHVDVLLKSLSRDADDYDLVHVFNLTRVHDALARSRECEAAGVPLVLSPIYHPPAWIDDYERSGRLGLAGLVTRRLSRDQREAGKALWHAARRPGQLRDAVMMCHTGYTRAQTEAVSLAAMVICNSQMELDTLRKELGYGGAGAVSHLGLSPAFLAALAEHASRPRSIVSDGRPVLLCVGRVEPNKGQLDLILVAKDLGCDVMLVGVGSRMSPGYVRRVHEEAQQLAGFRHISHVSQGELVGLYRSASAHVLASWFETVGLVTLEAVACGCPAVAPERSYIAEYLADACSYAQPGDRRSLRRSVERALQKQGQDEPDAWRAQAYTWKASVDALLVAYESVLS